MKVIKCLLMIEVVFLLIWNIEAQFHPQQDFLFPQSSSPLVQTQYQQQYSNYNNQFNGQNRQYQQSYPQNYQNNQPQNIQNRFAGENQAFQVPQNQYQIGNQQYDQQHLHNNQNQQYGNYKQQLANNQYSHNHQPSSGYYQQSNNFTKRPPTQNLNNRNTFIFNGDRENVKKILKFNYEISIEIEKFSLELLVYFLKNPVMEKTNFMISPFSIYHILSMILEGAEGSTYYELKTFLKMQHNPYETSNFLEFLNHNLDDSRFKNILKRFALLVRDENRPLKPEFENKIENIYDALIESVDFSNTRETVRKINNFVSQKTQGQITDVVTPDEILKAQLIMISGLYFKGQWKSEFQPSETTTSPFHNFRGEQIGEVDMMFQRNTLAFTIIQDIGSYVLELEYADNHAYKTPSNDGKGLSMIIVLPKKKQTLVQTAKEVYRYTMNKIYRELYVAKRDYGDENVEVYIPKFESTTDLDLRYILRSIGLTEIFEQYTAKLSKINPNYYISSMIHKTKISVDERGTTAVATTTSIFENKSAPQRFLANRPFLYFIVEKNTNLILFAGQYVNPNPNSD